MRQTGWKNFLASLALLFGSLCLSAIAGEIILRLLGHHGAPQSIISNIYPVDDQMLDWRYVPNSQLKLGRVVYSYNSVGFRDREHAIEKSPGITRVVVLGDSVTEGAGVEWDSVFAPALQSRLGGRFEVINIAAAGLNTPQEVHLLEQKALFYKPDYVILNFILNDCDFFSSFKGAARYVAEKDASISLLNISIHPRLKQLLKSSAALYFLKERLENAKARLMGVEETDYFTNLWSKAENRAKVVRGFDKLSHLAKEHRFEVVVIIWPLITDYKQYKFQHLHEWLKEQTETRGFSTVDLFPTFSRILYRDLQVNAEDNVHPNVLGHKLAVDALLGRNLLQPNANYDSVRENPMRLRR